MILAINCAEKVDKVKQHAVEKRGTAPTFASPHLWAHTLDRLFFGEVFGFIACWGCHLPHFQLQTGLQASPCICSLCFTHTSFICRKRWNLLSLRNQPILNFFLLFTQLCIVLNWIWHRDSLNNCKINEKQISLTNISIRNITWKTVQQIQPFYSLNSFLLFFNLYFYFLN